MYIYENKLYTKTIEQLILEFLAKAQDEVTAVHQAHTVHKRWNAPAQDEDPKRSLYEADTDAEETAKKWMKPTPPSATVGRAPKGTNINEVKGLDNEELDYDDDMEIGQLV